MWAQVLHGWFMSGPTGQGPPKKSGETWGWLPHSTVPCPLSTKRQQGHAFMPLTELSLPGQGVRTEDHGFGLASGHSEVKDAFPPDTYGEVEAAPRAKVSLGRTFEPRGGLLKLLMLRPHPDPSSAGRRLGQRQCLHPPGDCNTLSFQNRGPRSKRTWAATDADSDGIPARRGPGARERCLLGGEAQVPSGWWGDSSGAWFLCPCLWGDRGPSPGSLRPCSKSELMSPASQR